jgi:putative ABC transport system permease protein
MDTLFQDLRYGARSLRRQPGFTLIAVLTLAVGIGANTAIFSIVNATLLRPFPFREPERLMKVSLTAPGSFGDPANDDMVWSYPKFETFRQNQQVFEKLALYRSGDFNLTGIEQAERIRGEAVTADYFPLLGIPAIAGRTFLAEEDSIAVTQRAAILSHALWERRFGLDPGIVGKSITLDTRIYTVVGVLPSGFRGLTGLAEVWVPTAATDAEERNQRWSHSYDLIARLKPGVSAQQARSAVMVLGHVIDEAHPFPFGGKWGARARSLGEARIDPALRRSVLVLFGSVAFVLLIACVNIANLLLARGNAREREIAIRLAVGVSRGRLIRQLLTESVLLASIGAIAGIILAYWGVGLLGAINPASGNPFGTRISGLALLGLSSIRIDGTALLFTLGIALLTGVLFGLVPALHASRSDVIEALKSAASHAGRQAGIRAALTSKSVLVLTEIALALVLLIGSGLMIKSLSHLLSTRIGVDPGKVLSLRIELPFEQFQKNPSTDFFEQLETRVRALPGVASIGMSTCPPLAGGCNGTIIWFRDRPPVPKGSEPSVGVHWVSPRFFQTMKVPLLRGRWFTTGDRAGKPKVIIINETAARKFWPNEDPIGKHVAVGQGRFDDSAEIIGIAGDVRYGQINELPQPDTFISYLQSPRWSLMLFVRTAAEPASLTAAIRGEVRALDKNLPVYDIKTMVERFSDSTSRARFSTILLGIFASIALILAAVGIYGVMSYAVTQRTHEIGIRIALGAKPWNVLILVVRRGLGLTLAGIALGIFAALGATRVLESLLYEVKPSDQRTFVMLAALLGAVALLACCVPAWRAARMDPLVALHCE